MSDGPSRPWAAPDLGTIRSRLDRWLRAPVGLVPVASLGVIILLAPLWLWLDPLDGYSPRGERFVGLMARLRQLADPFRNATISGDDFPYLAEARTEADLRASLWRPHNSHVVPLFRLWTSVLARWSGTLLHVARTFALASWLTYVAATLLIGRLVARETGRPALGLVGMAAFGVSTVLEGSVRWYSAGQAIASGVVVLAMLAALQGWRRSGGVWRLAAAALLAAAAPLVWSAGLVAGPVGAAYLWADGRPRVRWWALAPLVATASVTAAVFLLAGDEVIDARNFHGRSIGAAADPVQGLISTAQATVEILIARNLGLVADTTPAQALALLLLLAVAWASTGGGPRRCSPLEAAGAAMVFLGFALVYTARGYYPFEQLRDLHWYQAVPQMGAILFVAGRWSGRGRDPGARGATTRGGLAAALASLLVALALQVPRERANLAAAPPSLTPSELVRFPIPELRRLRAREFAEERADWQRRGLARLDRAEALAREEGWSRAAIRTALGGPSGPKIWIGFAKSDGFDPVALLALPESGPAAPPGPIRAALLPLLTPEPYPRLPWLPPHEEWQPARDHDEAVRPGRP